MYSYRYLNSEFEGLYELTLLMITANLCSVKEMGLDSVNNELYIMYQKLFVHVRINKLY